MAEAARGPTLRPMSVADLVDEIFRLYRRNFGLLFGISALLWLPALILITIGFALFGFFDGGPLSLASSQAGLAALGIGLLVLLFALPILLGAITAGISDLYLGRPTSIGSCLDRGIRSMVKLIAVYVLVILAVMLTIAAVTAIFAIALGGVLGSSGLGAQFLLLLVLLLLVSAPAVWIAVTSAFVAPAIVVERAGVFRSISRSAFLVQGSRWRVIGINVLLALIQAVLFSIPSTFVSLLVVPVLGPAGLVVGQLVGVLAQVVYNPIQLGTTTLLYYDMRVRREAFDLTFAAERLAGS